MNRKTATIEVGMTFNPYRLFHGAFIPNCLLRYPDLSAYAKLIWARLAQFNGKNGRCIPSLNLISEETGISRMTVIRSIDELEKKGFIKKTPPGSIERLNGRTNTYEILFHQVFFDELSPPPEVGTSQVPIGYQSGTNQIPPYKAVEENQEENHPLKSPRGGLDSTSGLVPKGEEALSPQEFAELFKGLGEKLAAKRLNPPFKSP